MKTLNSKPKKKLDVVQLPVEEWQKYQALRLRALKEDAPAFGSSYEEAVVAPESKWKNRLQEVVEGKSWGVFGKWQDEMVGMAFALQDDEVKENSEIALIVSVYVVKEARGNGFAEELMEALIEKLINKGFKRAKLSVNEKQVAAVGLYTKMGFEVVDKEDSVTGQGEKCTELVMQKKLID